jgi:hypothetical protein
MTRPSLVAGHPTTQGNQIQIQIQIQVGKGIIKAFGWSIGDIGQNQM